MFCLQQSRLSMVQQSLLRQQELVQGDSYPFDQKFIYYLPTKNVTARKTILVSILSIAFVTKASKTSDFLFLLLFLVNYPTSKTTLRFPHSSSMNIGLGKFPSFQYHPYQFHLVLPQLY